MKDKIPDIYKSKFEKLKTKVQKEYYYHHNDKENINMNQNTNLLTKINNIFKDPNFVYKADVNIMYKNGNNINKKIIAVKDNYLLTLEGEKIYLSEIKDID